MTLEKDLQQLQSLEVGNVEAVIGDIERLKLQREEAEDKVTMERARYKTLVAEKLPKMIENIAILGKSIHDLEYARYTTDMVYDKSGSGRLPTYIELKIRRDGENSVLTVEYLRDNPQSDQCDGSFHEGMLEIKITPQGIGQIALNPRNTAVKKGLFRWESKRTADMTSVTVEEFTNWYFNSLQGWNYGEEFLRKIPEILSQVPKMIKAIFKERAESASKQAERKKLKADNLEAADVSDFS